MYICTWCARGGGGGGFRVSRPAFEAGLHSRLALAAGGDRGFGKDHPNRPFGWLNGFGCGCYWASERYSLSGVSNVAHSIQGRWKLLKHFESVAYEGLAGYDVFRGSDAVVFARISFHSFVVSRLDWAVLEWFPGQQQILTLR